MQQSNYEVEEKTVEKMLVAGIRMRGRDCDCGKGFSQLGHHFGRLICGKAMMLRYDTEFRKDEADFEVCSRFARRVTKSKASRYESFLVAAASSPS